MIVKVIKTPSGATVKIDDSMCAPRGSEQERMIIEEQRRVAYNILRGAAKRAVRERTTV